MKHALRYAPVLALWLAAGAPVAGAATLSAPQCSADDLALEPTAQKEAFVQPGWEAALKADPRFGDLEPKSLAQLHEDSGVTRTTVTSSHVVQMLAEALRGLRDREQQMIRDGQLLPLVEGKTYGAEEFKRRKESTEKARREVLEPMMKEAYRVYTDAVERRELDRKEPAPLDVADAFRARAASQREMLSSVIGKLVPGLKAKLGDIMPVARGKDLPLSYRDGRIVKIRFQRPGASHHVTLYPRMIVNQLTGEDEFFLKAMAQWKDYCFQRMKAAERDFRASIGNHAASATTMAGWGGLFGARPVRASLEREMRLAPIAYQTASRQYEEAKVINREMAALTDSELGAMMDLFRALRMGDMPRCHAQIKSFNDRMKAELKGERTSASPKFTREEKKRIDALAKDAVFYQDLYSAYTTLAAHALARNAATK